MGNGAGVQSRSSPSSRYARLEQLCRSEYFHHDPSAYSSALTEAMREDALDCLELLLVSGDTRRAQPLHLACSLGKLEAVEILLSAGFHGEATNRESRTPLHLCALCVSPEAGLCASVMALRFPRSTRRLDYEGLAPLHLAAQSDNVSVLRALLQVDGALLSAPAQSGLTALQIAERKNKAKAAEYLRFVQQQRGSSELQSQSQSQQRRSSEADMERIMEVWERFFENAFKMAGGMMYGSESDSDNDNGSDGEEEHKEQAQYYMDEKEEHYNYSNGPDDWLWWLVCYDYDNAEKYFVLHTWTGETHWLDDFTAYTCYERGYLCSYEDPYALAGQEVSSLYPESVAEAERRGWLPFFDQRDNYCQWMNVFSGSFEYYLPLGLHENWETLQSLGLHFCEEDTCWFSADQTVTQAWILVLPSDADRDFYYFNTITACTQWEPPKGWEELLAAWNGWTHGRQRRSEILV